MRCIPVVFPTRESRSRFVAEQFGDLLKGSVLDVGCWEADLRRFLPAARYTGIDVAGKPDVQVNLETAERLPFDNASFDTLVCTDVLEHLDSLHRVFDELVRVARRHIVVSLPNCWFGARRPLARGRGDFAHYGLPVERPVDRHKWFFNFTEARAFLEAHAARRGLRIANLFATEKPRAAPIRALRRLLYPGDRYLNRYAITIWCVLEKPAP